MSDKKEWKEFLKKEKQKGKKAIKNLKNKISRGEKIKWKVTSVVCFGGDYCCPYYGQHTKESLKHCSDCWNPNL